MLSLRGTDAAAMFFIVILGLFTDRPLLIYQIPTGRNAHCRQPLVPTESAASESDLLGHMTRYMIFIWTESPFTLSLPLQRFY